MTSTQIGQGARVKCRQVDMGKNVVKTIILQTSLIFMHSPSWGLVFCSCKNSVDYMTCICIIWLWWRCYSCGPTLCMAHASMHFSSHRPATVNQVT